jgi:hypothetical protein
VVVWGGSQLGQPQQKKKGLIPIYSPDIDKVLYLFVSSRAKMVSTLSMSSLAVIVMFMEGGSQVIPAQKTSVGKLVRISRMA